MCSLQDHVHSIWPTSAFNKPTGTKNALVIQFGEVSGCLTWLDGKSMHEAQTFGVVFASARLPKATRLNFPAANFFLAKNASRIL